MSRQSKRYNNNILEGLPAPTIKWSKNGERISTGSKYKINGNELKINSIRVEDQGVYICEAENPAGIASSDIELTVLQVLQYIN